MKPTTLTPIGFQQITPTTTTDVKTVTVPKGTSAILVSVETTNARLSFHGADPSSTVGHVFLKDLEPVCVPVGTGASIRAVSTASANAVVDLTFLR